MERSFNLSDDEIKLTVSYLNTRFRKALVLMVVVVLIFTIFRIYLDRIGVSSLNALFATLFIAAALLIYVFTYGKKIEEKSLKRFSKNNNIDLKPLTVIAKFASRNKSFGEYRFLNTSHYIYFVVLFSSVLLSNLIRNYFIS